jgi:hypothetical protein
MDLPPLRRAATGAATHKHPLSLTAHHNAGRFLPLILELGTQKRCVILRARPTALVGSTSKELS